MQELELELVPEQGREQGREPEPVLVRELELVPELEQERHRRQQ